MAQPFQNYQTNAPLGQAPFSGIQGPGVAASLPNGLDSSNLYNTLGSITEAMTLGLQMKKQRADQEAKALDRIKALTDQANSAFDNLFDMDQAAKGKSIAGLPGLDPRWEGPKRVNTEVTKEMEAMNAKLDAVRQSAITGSAYSNPKAMAEFERQVSKITNETRVNLMKNQDYIKYQRAQQAYYSLQDRIQEAKKNDKQSINIIEYQKFLKKYEGYMNEDPSVFIREEDFDPNKYIFSPERVVSRMETYFTNAFKPTSQSVREDVNGTVVERVTTVTPTVDDKIEDIMNVFGADPEFDALYQHNKALGFQGTKEDYLRSLASVYTQPDQTDYGATLSKPFNPYTRSNNNNTKDQTDSYIDQDSRTYQQFVDEDIKSGKEANFIKQEYGYDSKSTRTEYGRAKALHEEIGKRGFDPMTGTANARLVDFYINNDDIPIVYKYDYHNDKLLVGYNKNIPRTAGQQKEFVPLTTIRGKFDDYDTNTTIENKATPNSTDPKDFPIPSLYQKSLNPSQQVRAYKYVTDSNMKSRLNRLVDLLNRVDIEDEVGGRITREEWNNANIPEDFVDNKARFFAYNSKKRKAILKAEIEKLINEQERAATQPRSQPGYNPSQPGTSAKETVDMFKKTG